MKLYVGGIAYSVNDKELKEYFETCGKVVSAVVIKDRYSGQSKGFGFVEMEDVKEGENAIKTLDGTDLNGRSISVTEARPQEDRRQGGGNRRGPRNDGHRPY